MNDLINKLNILQKTALELNDVAEENLSIKKNGLDDIEDEEIKGKIKSISSEFEKMKKSKDIGGMNSLVVQLNKLMTELK